ncbi:MAG: chorismate synthase, partial [Mycobacterium sp.]|jgi:chorismate synthase|nr:chorismate synthase [Mycobacterium sp.]
VCAVPAAGVVVETMVALVLARAALEKFGGDSLAETTANIDSYLGSVRTRGAQQQEAEREPSGGQERSDRGISPAQPVEASG